MEVLGFIVVYVLPALFQMAVQVLVLSVGVYLGLRRFDRYKELKLDRELQAEFKAQSSKKPVV
jgi:hypothetical protein